MSLLSLLLLLLLLVQFTKLGHLFIGGDGGRDREWWEGDGGGGGGNNRARPSYHHQSSSLGSPTKAHPSQSSFDMPRKNKESLDEDLKRQVCGFPNKK